MVVVVEGVCVCVIVVVVVVVVVVVLLFQRNTAAKHMVSISQMLSLTEGHLPRNVTEVIYTPPRISE